MIQQFQRHAQELYAFCHDRLGDPESAADATAAAIARNIAPGDDPRGERLLLFRQVRRELSRFNVTLAPPVAGDPAGALVEGVVRDLRPHQREVLLLNAVHGFDTPELAQVLEVAPDTAAAMVSAAHRRFTSAMTAALRSGLPGGRGHGGHGPAIAGEIADGRFAAVLARVPRPHPPADLFARLLAQMVDPPDVSGPGPGGAGITAKKLDLPTSPPPEPSPAEEAITEPMPKLVDAASASSTALSFMPALRNEPEDPGPEPGEPMGFIPGAPEFPKPPGHGDVLVASSTARPPEPSDRTDEFAAVSSPIVLPDEWAPWPERPGRPGRPGRPERPASESERTEETEETEPEGEPERRSSVKRPGERRYDWLWELVGLLILALLAVLAMIYVPGWLM